MKHWNKVLVVAAVICGVAGIATSARLLVTAVHRYSTQKPLVRGAEDYSWQEDESEVEEITEPEETDGTDVDDTDDASEEEDQTMYGSLDGNSYTNEWFNLRMELPENYIMLSGDELGYAQDIAADEFMTEEGQERLENAQDYGNVRYVLGAVEDSGSVTVNIGIEKVFNSMTIDQYLNLMQKSIERDITDSLGLTLEGITEETIGGETYRCVHEKMVYDASVGEMHMDQYLRLVDGYVFVMSVGYSAEAAPQKDALVAAMQSY